jgi:hypothetical protein
MSKVFIMVNHSKKVGGIQYHERVRRMAVSYCAATASWSNALSQDFIALAYHYPFVRWKKWL